MNADQKVALSLKNAFTQKSIPAEHDVPLRLIISCKASSSKKLPWTYIRIASTDSSREILISVRKYVFFSLATTHEKYLSTLEWVSWLLMFVSRVNITLPFLNIWAPICNTCPDVTDQDISMQDCQWNLWRGDCMIACWFKRRWKFVTNATAMTISTWQIHLLVQ